MRTLESLKFAQNVVDVFLDCDLSNGLSPAEAFTLNVIALKISSKDCWAMPYKYLSDRTKLSLPTVKRAVKSLAKKKLLRSLENGQIEKYRTTSGRKMNNYSLHTKLYQDVYNRINDELTQDNSGITVTLDKVSPRPPSISLTISDIKKGDDQKSISASVAPSNANVHLPPRLRRPTMTQGSFIDMPIDFVPSPENKRRAELYGVNLEIEIDKCRTWNAANGYKKLDWEAGLNSWLIKGHEVRNRKGVNNNYSMPTKKSEPNPSRCTVTDEQRESFKRVGKKPCGCETKSIKEIIKELKTKSTEKGIHHPVFDQMQQQERRAYLISLNEIDAMSLSFNDQQDRNAFLDAKKRKLLSNPEKQVVPFHEWSDGVS